MIGFFLKLSTGRGVLRKRPLPKSRRRLDDRHPLRYVMDYERWRQRICRICFGSVRRRGVLLDPKCDLTSSCRPYSHFDFDKTSKEQSPDDVELWESELPELLVKRVRRI
jgi:hypothetical protein